MSRFKREHSAGATNSTTYTFFFLFFSLCRRFLFCQSTHSATVVVVYVVVYAFFFAFLFDGISWGCLSLSKVIACIETPPPPMTTRYYYGTRRQRRKRRNDEKEPTDEKASSSKNRSLRARTRYINTNICIYIYFFFYETNRQSKERSSRLGSGRSIRIGFR